MAACERVGSVFLALLFEFDKANATHIGIIFFPGTVNVVNFLLEGSVEDYADLLLKLINIFEPPLLHALLVPIVKPHNCYHLVVVGPAENIIGLPHNFWNFVFNLLH